MKITDWKTETEHRVARATALFKEGYNCAQSVACTYCDLFGGDCGDILKAPFTVVSPDSSNPYKQMYVAN